MLIGSMSALKQLTVGVVGFVRIGRAAPEWSTCRPSGWGVDYGVVVRWEEVGRAPLWDA
jgi:hypothetical protein